MTHRIRYTVRQIAAGDLPTVRDLETGEQVPATAQQLLNMGIFPTPDPEHYSCAEQERRDDDLLIDTGEEKWDAHGIDIPGTLVTHGPNRFKELPTDVRGRVLQARVITAPAPGARAYADASLVAQRSAIAEYVGDGVSIDVGTVQDEAARLADVAESSVERATITVAEINPDLHIVEVTDIEPHRWAGERRR